jgi:hypothetical protein
MASQYFAGLFSALTSQACVVLNTPPTFSGVSSVVANADGSVSVNWSAATGVAVPPVRYRIFIAAGSVSGAVLFAGSTYMVTGTNATTFKAYTDASGNTLVAGSIYTFGVRAVDSHGNADNNLAVLTATVLYNLYALVQSVPGAVWDQLKSAHTISGSFGDYLDAKVSLVQTTATALTQYNALISAIGTLQTSATALSQYNALTTAIGLTQTAATALTQYNALISAIGSPQQTSTALTQYNALQSAIALTQTAATALSQFNTLVTDITATAGNVWDQLKSAHTVSGSFGAYLDAQVSLVQTTATALSQYNNLQTAIATLQTAATALSQYNALIIAIGIPQQASTALTQYNNLQAAIALTQTAATALSQYNTLISDITAIPTNPLLTTDSRLNNLDATISSRQSAATALSQFNTLVSDITGISANVWDVLQSGHTTVGTFGSYLNAQISLLQTAATALSQFNTLVSDIVAIPTNPLLTTDSRLNDLDAPISSRLPTSSYVVPDNAGISAIEAKTNNLPVDPASQSLLDAQLQNIKNLTIAGL